MLRWISDVCLGARLTVGNDVISGVLELGFSILLSKPPHLNSLMLRGLVFLSPEDRNEGMCLVAQGSVLSASHAAAGAVIGISHGCYDQNCPPKSTR